jgi:hypothetical protein
MRRCQQQTTNMHLTRATVSVRLPSNSMQCAIGGATTQTAQHNKGTTTHKPAAGYSNANAQVMHA